MTDPQDRDPEAVLADIVGRSTTWVVVRSGLVLVAAFVVCLLAGLAKVLLVLHAVRMLPLPGWVGSLLWPAYVTYAVSRVWWRTCHPLPSPVLDAAEDQRADVAEALLDQPPWATWSWYRRVASVLTGLASVVGAVDLFGLDGGLLVAATVNVLYLTVLTVTARRQWRRVLGPLTRMRTARGFDQTPEV